MFYCISSSTQKYYNTLLPSVFFSTNRKKKQKTSKFMVFFSFIQQGKKNISASSCLQIFFSVIKSFNTQLLQLICTQLLRNQHLSSLVSLMGTSTNTLCSKLNALLWINTATGFAYKATSEVRHDVLISRVVLIPITSV